MYLHRRALIFFIIMLLCVNQMNFFEFVASAEGQVTQPMNEEPNPAVDNNNPDTPNKPLINVRSYHTKPSDVVPGGNVSLSITFQNPTQVTAKDVKITLGEDGMDFLKTFSPRDRGNVFYINEIKGNQFVQKNIVLDTSRDAINQNYNLTLKIIFYDEKGNQFESTETIGIRVVKVDIDRGRPELVLSDIKINPSVVRNNENIEIKAKLKNVGQKNAFNVQLVINDGNVNSPFSTLLSGNHIPLSSKDLYVNKEMNVSFKVALNQYAVDGINNLTLNLTYNDGHKEFSHSEVIGIPVEKNMDKPNLLISAVNTEPAEVEVGEEFRLRLKIENFGGEEASDIRGVVSSIEGSSGLDVFFPINRSNTFYLKQLAKGQVLEEDIRLFISPRAEAKTYNVVVNLEYRDKNGNHYTTSEVIGVKVYKNGKTFYTDSDPLLIINGRSLNYSPVTLGKSFDITLDLFNATNTTAKNITITFVEDGTDQLRTFSPSAGSNVLFLPELKGEQTTSVTMALDISKEIPTQIYNLNVKIEYENFEGEKFDSMATVGIPVKGNDNKTIGPELTISSYELSSPLIEIGSTFDISLNVKNIGDESASNVKISLSSPENGNQVVLTPFGNSNTIVAEKVSSGEIVNRNIKYLISTEGKSRIYTVNVSMSYVDEEGQQRTTHETISIPVESPRDIKITSLNFPKHVNIDEKFGLGLEFINIGKEPIDNLQVSFEGDFNVDEPYYYINKFEPGNTEYFESVALVDSPGTYRGAIYLKYKDGYDQEKIISKPIEIQVSDPTAAEINEMEAEEPKGFWSKVLGFILAIFGLG